MEEEVMAVTRHYRKHLKSASDLVTTHAATRSGFVALALEKNRQASPFVEQARALKVKIAEIKAPQDLLDLDGIDSALLSAAGVSDKAMSYLELIDRRAAILALVRNYLEPEGDDWREELVFRFLLTKGDSLGGTMRNIAGELAERKMSRAIVAALNIDGVRYQYLDNRDGVWRSQPASDVEIEHYVDGLSWERGGKPRTLAYNIRVPVVAKNVDLCLLDCSPVDIAANRLTKVVYGLNELYIALGELKGGIDPAGADEHWKTANTALKRIERAFQEKRHEPLLFFVGAAIQSSMADEIWSELERGSLSNAANLTNADQVASLCGWLCNL